MASANNTLAKITNTSAINMISIVNQVVPSLDKMLAKEITNTVV